MELNDVKTPEDVRKLLDSRKDLTHIHCAVVDHTGQMRGKTYSVEKFSKGFEAGIPLTPNVASADLGDALYPIEGLLDDDASFPDALCQPVPESVRQIPWESPRRNLQFLMEFTGEAAEYACPRTLLRQQVEKAANMGFKFFGSFELEFRLFKETLDEAVEKNFRQLTPFPKYKQNMGVLRHQTDNDFLNGLLDTLFDMGLDIEAYHTELDVGFHELVMRYQEGVKAADDCAFIQTFTQAYAQRCGRLASFMARPEDEQDGSALHTHLSLQGIDGSPVFYDESAENNMSQVMHYFIGGMQRMLPELQLLMASTVNAYRRYAPGLFAPIATTWGVDNRTVGLRVVGNDSPKGIRVENRLAGADANPYFVHAATLAAGLWGIENKVTPTAQSKGMSWTKMDEQPDWVQLHDNMDEAITRFRNSELAKEAFGVEFVRVFSENRRFHNEEFKQYLADSGQDGDTITDWELNRFMELA